MLFGTSVARCLMARTTVTTTGTAANICRHLSPQRLSPRPFSSLEAFPGVPRIGLIGGDAVDDVFTRKLDFSAVDVLLTDREHMLAAVDKDAEALGMKRVEYLNTVYVAVRNFVESNELCGREKLKAAVSAVLNRGAGNFEMIVGGKNSGKSLILGKLAAERCNEHEGSVLLIDGRASGADLMQGIKAALSQNDWKKLVDAGIAAEWGSLVAHPFIQPLFRRRVMQSVTASTLIQVFVAIHNKQGRIPCIILDEANLILQDGDDAARQQTLGLLALLKKLTRQDQQLNVILASSSHTELRRLERLGFNLMNLDGTIFASEASPREMLTKLKELKVGDNLAGLLVGIYGGHIWTLYNAVAKLSTDPHFTPMRALPCGLQNSVIECVRAEQVQENGSQGMRKMLQDLAETGFVPLEGGDPRAERLTRVHIASVVDRYGHVSGGIPSHAWHGSHTFLVPSTQCTRLLIAQALTQLDQEHEANAK